MSSDNPFDKEQSTSDPYAVYVNPIELSEYKVIKTFTNPKAEQHDSYWLVANRNMLTEEYDIIKMKVSEIKQYSFLLNCTPNWSKHYGN